MKRQMLLVNGRGFSLIEALVALAIMSFGLLAVANFQISLVSGSSYNKARTEAMALAQEKLDELRNYVIEPELVANLEDNSVTASDLFPDNVTAATYPQSATLISGTNAQFRRQWTVSTVTGANNVRNVVVTVSWVDSSGVNQQVQLESEVAWKNPRGTADLGNAATPAVPNPTGKAKLGEGTVTASEKSNGTDNGDGTTSVAKGNDLLLVNNTDGNNDNLYDVVLTLRDACLTQTCTDFVKISGRVFIDQAPQSPVLPSEVSVLASDAAYCAQTAPQLSDQYIIDTNNDNVADAYYGNGDGNADYKYFDYTCYLGGGWYGNIGLLFSGTNVTRNDYACVGDPAATAAASDAWKRYELAKRRVYRGMTYEVVNGSAVTDLSSNVIYYTKGIADAKTFPDPNWPARNHGHDYVIMRATGNSVTAADCLAPMTRPDADTSSGGYPMFSNAAGDFICLNEDNDVNSYVYLDTLRTGFVADDTCPFDPSRPPSARRTISGTIVAPLDLTGIAVNTSDGPGNCTLTLGNPTTTATYTCDIYLWQDDRSNLNPKPLLPWEGEIQFSQVPYRMVLSTNTITYTGNNAVSSNTTAPQVDGIRKTNAIIRGTISAPGNDLMNDPGGLVTVTSTEPAPYGQCTVTAGVDGSNQPDGTVDYVCDVFGPDQNTGWDGTVTVAMPRPEYNCPSYTTDYVGVADNTTVVDDYNCTGPEVPIHITGSLSGASDLTAALTNISASNNGTCTKTEGASSLSFDCTVIHTGPGWTGTISITTSPTAYCGSAPLSFDYTAQQTDAVITAISCSDETTGPVQIDGVLVDIVTPNVQDIFIGNPAWSVVDLDTGLAADFNCNATTYTSAATGDLLGYSCRSNYNLLPGQRQNLQLTVNPASGLTACAPNPLTFSAVRPNDTLTAPDITIAKPPGKLCP